MPPTVLLWGATGKQWSTTDRVLAQALTLLEDSRCGCGCNGWAEECLDENLQDEWEGHIRIHHRGAALAEFREDHTEELKQPGAVAYLVDGRREASTDGATFGEESAAISSGHVDPSEVRDADPDGRYGHANVLSE